MFCVVQNYNIYVFTCGYKLGAYKPWIMFVCDADEQSVEFIKHKRMRVDDFILLKCIGRGAFGEVQLV